MGFQETAVRHSRINPATVLGARRPVAERPLETLIPDASLLAYVILPVDTGRWESRRTLPGGEYAVQRYKVV
eukprot:4595390-Pleurochrysis_carterae.AAC.2